MARRNANLAGLAALGALGYKLAQGRGAPIEDRVGTPVLPTEDDQYNPDVRFGGSADLGDELGTRQNLETGEYYTPSGATKKTSRGGAGKGKTARTPSISGDDQYNPDVRQGRKPGQGGPRGTRYSSTDTGDETERLARRYPAPPKSDDLASPERRKNAGMLQSIKEYYQSPSSMSGVGRNISNTLNATAGLSAPGFVPQMTQRQFNARAAARRAEEGLSEAEVAEIMRRRALNEADTTGGAVGYKKGGAVKAKKMVFTNSGGKVSSASKRADGIAAKGKTKCKMY